MFHTRFSQKKKGNSSLLRYTTHVAQVFYGACTPDGVDGLLLAVGFPSLNGEGTYREGHVKAASQTSLPTPIVYL